jgi:hypothetical protein
MSWVWHHKKAGHREPDWNAPLPENRNARLEYLYAWERRCRGYDLHPYPVALEPPFTSYRPGTPLDFSPPAPQAASASLSHISLQLPLEQKVTVSSAAGFLAALASTPQPLAFEIIANMDEIAYQMTCSREAVTGVLAAAPMHWPQAVFEAGTDVLGNACGDLFQSDHATLNVHSLNTHSFVVEFGLQQFAFLPLACHDSFISDPLAGVLAGLGALETGEVAGLQILFTPASPRWNDALQQVAGEFDETPESANGRSFHRDDPQQLAARAKLGHPLYAAVIRVFALSTEGQSSTEGQARAFTLCKTIGGALGTFNLASGQTGNALLALANQDPHAPAGNTLPANGLFEVVLHRTSHRSGLLLSLPELVGLVHPPAETVLHPRLLRHDPAARSLSESLLEASGVRLGLHSYRNQEQTLVWPDEYRNRHAYILGATRMGKSTLLLNLVMQDIAAGRGLCLIDPHGDLALDVLARIPAERAGDVLHLDLSDREYPLALGLLEAGSEQERRLLCSDLLSVLHRLFASSWGDRLEHILRHAILTLLAAGQKSAEPYTLRDIRPLLSNKAFRERIVGELEDLDLRAFWHGEFHGYTPATFAPIYNKLGLLLSSPLVRNIVAGRQSKLSFADVIARKQILLVNLAGSQIGSDQSHFLGALLVSKLQIAAMGSLRLGQSERTPFTLYVDEFQNFLVSSFEIILSEAGKAGLSLVMANQFLEQLAPSLQTAILSNAGTLCSFRVSSDSGRLLEKEFAGHYKSQELVSLHRGQAIVRVGSAADSYDITTLPPLAAMESSFSELIRHSSRERICRPRGDVEDELTADAKKQAEEQEAAEREEAERKAAAKISKEVKVSREAKAPAEIKAKKPASKDGPTLKARTVSTEQMPSPPVSPASPISLIPQASAMPEMASSESVPQESPGEIPQSKAPQPEARRQKRQRKGKPQKPNSQRVKPSQEVEPQTSPAGIPESAGANTVTLCAPQDEGVSEDIQQSKPNAEAQAGLDTTAIGTEERDPIPVLDPPTSQENTPSPPTPPPPLPLLEPDCFGVPEP